MRTFFGISLSEEQTEALERLTIGLEGIRWVDPKNFHLTLVFLGELNADQVEKASEIAGQIQALPFISEVSGVGIFGHKFPEVLYANVISSEGLLSLWKSLDSSLRRAGFSIEKKEYRPHITIGRFRKNPDRRLESYLEEFNDFRIGEIQVSEFHLFSSKNGPDGVIYRVEESYPLRIG